MLQYLCPIFLVVNKLIKTALSLQEIYWKFEKSINVINASYLVAQWQMFLYHLFNNTLQQMSSLATQTSSRTVVAHFCLNISGPIV